MRKYYTRACNFHHGKAAKKLIKKSLGLPLCGNNNIAFSEVEILSRKKNEISRVISIKSINKLTKSLRKIVKADLKKIISKRKNLGQKIKINEPVVMGVLNLTPDSFSDGGMYNKRKKAFLHIKNMINSGADIIDIGGESTRPGSRDIPYKKEWNRISSVVSNFKRKYPKICLSIDTRKPEVMTQAINKKADIVNDVSGFQYRPDSIEKLKGYNVWKVLHHMQGTPNTMQINPKYKNVLLDIFDFFEEKLNKDFKKFKYKKFILDPGIGFGKKLKHNLILLNKISLFHSLGFPLLVGTSRKRFINQISGKFDSKERVGGTLSSIIYMLSQGVQIFRVHNVREIKQGILVYKKILLEK